ncbi:hypothetical protein [Paenibacillus polysaccharolyticus]|nr:hypothetical protein [Paenibacillus polysaccharolyticus]
MKKIHALLVVLQALIKAFHMAMAKRFGAAQLYKVFPSSRHQFL